MAENSRLLRALNSVTETLSQIQDSPRKNRVDLHAPAPIDTLTTPNVAMDVGAIGGAILLRRGSGRRGINPAMIPITLTKEKDSGSEVGGCDLPYFGTWASAASQFTISRASSSAFPASAALKFFWVFMPS